MSPQLIINIDKEQVALTQCRPINSPSYSCNENYRSRISCVTKILKRVRVLKMKSASHSWQCRDASLLSLNETRVPERNKNNSMNKEAKEESTMKKPFRNSRKQYEDTVLKAYGIVPVAREKRNNFVLSGKESGRCKPCPSTGKLQNMLEAERRSESCCSATQELQLRTRYEHTVLKAYGILPAQAYLSNFQCR